MFRIASSWFGFFPPLSADGCCCCNFSLYLSFSSFFLLFTSLLFSVMLCCVMKFIEFYSADIDLLFLGCCCFIFIINTLFYYMLMLVAFKMNRQNGLVRYDSNAFHTRSRIHTHKHTWATSCLSSMQWIKIMTSEWDEHCTDVLTHKTNLMHCVCHYTYLVVAFFCLSLFENTNGCI